MIRTWEENAMQQAMTHILNKKLDLSDKTYCDGKEISP